MSLTIRAEGLKALKKFEWNPSGVCALVGPNGAGKSTALRIIQSIQNSLEVGYDDGLRVFGAGPLTNLESRVGVAQVSLRFGAVTWKLRLDRSTVPFESASRMEHELFTRGNGATTQVRSSEGTQWGEDNKSNQLLLRQLRGRLDPDLTGLCELMSRSRVFSRPDLGLLRGEGSTSSNDVVLEVHARNLFAVLRNWRDKSEHEFRFRFVDDSMKELFPWFRRLDFENWGPRQGAQLPATNGEKLLPSDWSDGFFTSLAHLCAIASVDQGLVAIDEPENSLHPELINRLVELMREWSRTQATTVVLATHSPVVLDQFRDEPEKVFVMQPGHEQQPVQLDQLKQRDWLQHFSLGDLYSHLEVGASSP